MNRLRTYKGYLSPWLGKIERWHREGLSSMEIGRRLNAMEVRSPNCDCDDHSYVIAGIVQYILALGSQRVGREKAERRLAWAREQVVLAERALAEFDETER